MFQPALYTLLYVLSSLLVCSSFRPWPPYCRCHVNQRLAQDELEGQIHRLDNSNEITSTEIELLLLHTDIGESMKAQFPEAIANSEVKGRESVDSAMQRYQRLVQQMDRSDGRPDISFDTLSERYFEFIGTCIRTPGQAWMAAVAGLQYVGIFRDKFELDECGKYKIIDVAKLAYTSSRILLDLDGEKVKEISTVGDITAQLKVQNLQLGLLRIAVRHAVAGENEGKTHPIPSHPITSHRYAYLYTCVIMFTYFPFHYRNS